MNARPVTKSISAQNTFTDAVPMAPGSKAMLKARVGGGKVTVQVSNDEFVSDITDAYNTTADTVQTISVEGSCQIRAGIKTGDYVGAAYVELR